ncbi:unnamed protein product [Anisakis simplex]|uniref:Tetraspanin n=1 Tax=Anisakis simplex TaxID=6269 RepID=A0A3P6N6D3_ANISI|nr:unnamed protein product [Anisakis simplex]
MFFSVFRFLQVGGLGLVIAGAVLQLKYTGLLDILGDERLATPIFLLTAGALCALLGFLGCCGAIRENYCLTVSFAVLLALVLLVETAAAIAAYALHEPLQASLSQQLTLGLGRYNRSAGVTMAWDQTQIQFACCGVHNHTDWITPPDSCCVHLSPGCGRIEQNLHPAGYLHLLCRSLAFPPSKLSVPKTRDESNRLALIRILLAFSFDSTCVCNGHGNGSGH